MAYYISFLKTLSLKLNAHTIHFFYNEHTNDFPLYTEAIKFFNHPESMVRIAVRTLTLNVYKVEDASMLAFIRDRTAAPYFSNIVWFIGKHVQELDTCVRNDADHQSQNRLSDLVAEHLDHLHYLNDILLLNIIDLNQVLTDHLLHKLLLPLYIYSLLSVRRHSEVTMEKATMNLARVLNKPLNFAELSLGLVQNQDGANGKISCVVALFLLSQVFLIISHSPLIPNLSWIILKSEKAIFEQGMDVLMREYHAFRMKCEERDAERAELESNSSTSGSKENLLEVPKNITDEQKEQLASTPTDASNISRKLFLEIVYNALDCTENDYAALFALCLLYAIANNKGVLPELLDLVLKPRISTKSTQREPKYSYNTFLVEKILHIVILSCQPTCRVRLVTLELALKLLVQLVIIDGSNVMNEPHKTSIEAAKAQSTALVRNFYKSEEIFLDMFEHEYCDMSKGMLNVEWLCMDSAILLPPTGTPLTGIDFTKRLPCGEVERARRAIRVYFLVRDAVFTLNGEVETQLPLTNPQSYVQIDTALDLNNSDLIACTVVWKDAQKIRRFLVIDVIQLILVEPDTKRLGWGVAKLVGFLQDIEVTGDKDDSRCLHITIHRPLSNSSANRVPLLSAKFVFDDNIRCMAAKQRLTKGRLKARQKKMQHIARLLDIAGQTGPPSPAYVGVGNLATRYANRNSRDNRPLFHTGRVPGFAAPRRESHPGIIHRTDDVRGKRDGQSPSRIALENAMRDQQNGSTSAKSDTYLRRGSQSRSRESSGNRVRSRDGSPRMPRPRSEEIPLELIKKTPSSVIDMSPKISILARPQVPKVESQASTSIEGEAAPAVVSSSEETSFIAKDKGSTQKRKGTVETV